ncbi:MAG: ferredoxin [Mycobacterium sp.]|jgi:ferredoxin|nr:ferredoxin [Mycobacterium sp.]
MAVTQPTLLVTVDRAKCCGYTLCAAEGPDVYSIDDAGYAVAMDGVPADLEAQACRGAEACPDGAITVRRIGEGE